MAKAAVLDHDAAAAAAEDTPHLGLGEAGWEVHASVPQVW